MSKYIHIAHDNSVQAEVVVTTRRNGPYAVIVSDPDTGSQVGTKYFQSEDEAVAYAARCVS